MKHKRNSLLDKLCKTISDSLLNICYYCCKENSIDANYWSINKINSNAPSKKYIEQNKNYVRGELRMKRLSLSSLIVPSNLT